MKKLIKYLPKSLIYYLSSLNMVVETNKLLKVDKKRLFNYGITQNAKKWSYENLEAQITKVYHSIEKGLAYNKLRLGFGKKNIEMLFNLLEIYDKNGFKRDNDCYQSAINTLNKYIELHEKSDINIEYLKKRISNYNSNSKSIENLGGVYNYKKSEIITKSKSNFREFSLSRHSVRDFSEVPVEMNTINKAIKLAQHTPSACNRQAWGVEIVSDEITKKLIRGNQNGNKGFGEKFDKILVITGNTEYFYVGPERNQVYVDGGMYAMNILYSLHYYNIAAVPLSASLSNKQEKNIREGIQIKNSEVIIMFVGIGNYLDEYKVPKSHRREPSIKVI